MSPDVLALFVGAAQDWQEMLADEFEDRQRELLEGEEDPEDDPPPASIILPLPDIEEEAA